MDNLPPAGFQFAGEDYGGVDFPSSLSSDMQPVLNFTGTSAVFPQNQRGTAGYSVSPFHMNYSQQGGINASMSALPSGSFRGRFTEYPNDQSPHLPMSSIPSSAAPGMISDRLPSFSTIVSSSGTSSTDVPKNSQALYTSMSAQQLAFQAAGGRGGNQSVSHFDGNSFPDQIVSGKAYTKSPSLGSASPGMGATNYVNNIPHSSIMQHSSHNGNGQHLSPRSFKEEVIHQQYSTPGMHSYGHGAAQNPGESMTLPKFKHKYQNQHPPRRTIGPFKFFIIGKTERPTIFNRGTQTTNEEEVEEFKFQIPKRELFQNETEELIETEQQQQQQPDRPIKKKKKNKGNNGTPRITFPYDPVPDTAVPDNSAPLSNHGVGEFKEYPKNSKFLKTVIAPSMEDAAGKATMTTCIANKATIVTVGIVSRTQQQPGSETTSSTNKNVMSTGNIGYQPTPKRGRPPKQNAENMEHLMQERMAKARDLEQERMEVSVRIDDTQYIQVGSTKRWQCTECDKSYTTKHNLVMHVLDHSGIKPHLCLKCGKYFKQLSHLNTHMLTHDKIKPHTCNMCGKGFTQISHLKRHLQVSEKNGYCANLRKRSSSGQSPLGSPDSQDQPQEQEHHLKAHQFTHTGLKPYTCDTCGRSFNQRANLQRHKLIHDTTRSYKCNICDKQFTQPQTLKAHQVVHAERKPFECNVCGKEFGRYHNLQGHMHMHSNSKPYVCFCGSTFTLKGNLNRHKKVKHGLNETTDVMEEDAVNFLSSLSERVRDDYGADDDESQGSEDGKSARRGRSSVPNRMNDRGSVNESTPVQPGMLPTGTGTLLLQQNQHQQQQVQQGGGRPFVIQNPDTDEEMDEEEEGEIANPHNGGDNMNQVMNFQPLNVQGDDGRPRRQTQRHSPNPHNNDYDGDTDGYEGEDADTDWMPGSRKKKMKTDA